MVFENDTAFQSREAGVPISSWLRKMTQIQFVLTTNRTAKVPLITISVFLSVTHFCFHVYCFSVHDTGTKLSNLGQ